MQEADELRKVLEMAKRKTREAEENTKIAGRGSQEDDCCGEGKSSGRNKGDGTRYQE